MDTLFFMIFPQIVPLQGAAVRVLRFGAWVLLRCRVQLQGATEGRC